MTSGLFTIPLISTDGSSHHSSPESVALNEHRHFIAGPENALLRVLANELLTRPPQFNPLTLCGPIGAGKSHLLYGLVERHKTWSTDSRVTFLTAADFARGLARAIEVDSVAEWRDKHCRVDLFVLDDLQDLAGKAAAQQELVHTIDLLIEQEVQVLFGSRHAALDWTWMLPTLRSRLDGGLIIPIALPALPTRQRIAQEIAAQLGLPADATSVLSDATGPLTYSRIRQALLQPFHDHTKYGQTKSAAAAESSPIDSPKGSVSKESTSKGSLSKITKLVARHSHVKVADMLGPSRRQSVVRARGIAFYLARTLLHLSFDEIGTYFGGRDHTTVLHSWRKTSERLEKDVRLKHEVNKLQTLLADNFEIQRLGPCT